MAVGLDPHHESVRPGVGADGLEGRMDERLAASERQGQDL